MDVANKLTVIGGKAGDGYTGRWGLIYIHYCGSSLVPQTVKNLTAIQETGFDPWVRKIPWRREWLPTPVFLPEEFYGQRSLEGYI